MRHRPRSPVLIFILALLAAPLAGAAAGRVDAPGADDASRRAIDRIFDDAMARYRLPGLAIGVVEDGVVTYQRTAGELVAGEGAAITPDSVFKIASNTKSMTTALLARLVDAGKLRWDDPVTRYLPDFRMHEDWVTREMQVRDLLIHNSGLRAGAGDLMLWPEPNTFTRADILRGLRYLKPVHSFRSRYDYDNLLYIIAGEVAAAAGGAPYETLLRREVFEPLGLSRCRIGDWSRDAVGDVAQPHVRRDGGNVAVRRDGAQIAATTMDPAGGVRCSLRDMTAWIGAWLDPERAGADGKPWLSPRQREELWRPQMAMTVSKRQREWSRTHFAAYGYGWRLSDTDGRLKVSHTGTLMGMYSLVTLLPERRSGFVVLINGEAGQARSVLDQVLSERIGAPATTRTVAYYADALEREAAAPAAKRAPDTSKRTAIRPSTLSGRLGVYRDPWFGEASVCARGDGVEFVARKSPLLAGKIMSVGERLLLDWSADEVDAEAWLDFATAADGAVSLTLAKVDPDADFSYDYEDLAFARIGDCP
ncbi:serine hydrolase [Lysobacter antibioticus]|uniref:Beta-lactamase family protein n=1 Tax=Lysobacter antibioticus TaxID=84531 RepID=A0A0S2F5U8_LYSAN|nr:serine hydrolase [Lysobacter antibioticus]ALN78910.1 beta-lactamase family protein [Lysobacter antibioticus]